MLFVSNNKRIQCRRCRLLLRVVYLVNFITNASALVKFQKFTRWNIDGLRVKNVDVTFYNRHLLQCAILCFAYPGCISFNRHNLSGNCELSTKPFDVDTAFLSEESSWNMYEKGNCGLGAITGKHCIMVPRNGKNWSDARQICKSGGADLVQIADESEMKAVTAAMNDIFPISTYGYYNWIGLKRVETGEFVWPDMSPLAYENFTDGEPNDSNDCVTITNYQSSWVWKSFICSESFMYVCERRNILD